MLVAMSPHLKRMLSVVYGAAIVLVCVFLAALTVGYAWGGHTRSRSDAVALAVLALFFVYAAAVLVFQFVQSRQYELAVNKLGFALLEWKEAPFSDALRLIVPLNREIALSRVVHGVIQGKHVHLFNYASDVAWWSKKRTIVALERPQAFSDADGTARRLVEKADANLAVHHDWLIIHARQEVRPITLPGWLEIVVEITSS